MGMPFLDLYVCHNYSPSPARTATKVQEMIGTVNTSGALSAFEKMEEKGTISLFSKLSKTCQCITSEIEVWPLVRRRIIIYR